MKKYDSEHSLTYTQFLVYKTAERIQKQKIPITVKTLCSYLENSSIGSSHSNIYKALKALQVEKMIENYSDRYYRIKESEEQK